MILPLALVHSDRCNTVCFLLQYCMFITLFSLFLFVTGGPHGTIKKLCAGRRRGKRDDMSAGLLTIIRVLRENVSAAFCLGVPFKPPYVPFKASSPLMCLSRCAFQGLTHKAHVSSHTVALGATHARPTQILFVCVSLLHMRGQGGAAGKNSQEGADEAC